MSKKWFDCKGEQNDIVISTRVRLARNVKDYPFPSYISSETQKEVNALVAGALEDQPLRFIDMETIDQIKAISMYEQHITSPGFSLSRTGKGLLVNENGSVCIMLGEEDHIRIQVMKPGLDLDGAFKEADRIDDIIAEKIQYAFSDTLGYLTQCPTNLGTAMRASVLLHLPALSAKGQTRRLSSMVSKLGLTIRSAYGEGSQSNADLYQLSNQVTLGISEENAIANLKAITLQIVNQERYARRELMENERFEDNIWRAYGILKNTRTISNDEFLSLISLVMVGMSQGLFEMNFEKINALILNVQPATLAIKDERAKYAGERDRLRAKIVREALT